MIPFIIAMEVDSKTGKKRRGRGREEEDRPLQSGVVYVGHLPHGFYEEELRSYFSQFGAVKKVKVARNKKVTRSLASLLQGTAHAKFFPFCFAHGMGGH